MKKILLALSTFVVMALAGDFEDGLVAYKNNDYKKAIELYQKAAEQGNAEAQYKLGIMYQNGKGAKQDYKKAIKLYEVAAIKGNVDAQYKLSNIYTYGFLGAEVNSIKAAFYLQLMADKGVAKGQYDLALMYANGEGLKQNNKKALELFQKAAEQGYRLAENNLGVMYHNGLGTKQDYKKAIVWYKKAAKQGQKDAVQNINKICSQNPTICK